MRTSVLYATNLPAVKEILHKLQSSGYDYKVEKNRVCVYLPAFYVERKICIDELKSKVFSHLPLKLRRVV